MSIDGEKKTFVMKHTFIDVLKNSGYGIDAFGNKENHFNVPWRLLMSKHPDAFSVYLECLKYCVDEDWSIDATIEAKILTNTGPETIVKNRVFFRMCNLPERLIGQKYEKCLVNGNLPIECHVTINKMAGIHKIIKRFDDSNKKFSDVVLKVKDQKFYVNKMYLASHSTYFEALFMGNFDESKQSKVVLPGIDPYEFQKFLELIHAESALDDDIIEEVMQLADFFDAKTAIKRCEEFLIHRSKQNLKFKFGVAVKYEMRKLKENCKSEIKTMKEIQPHPEDDARFGRKACSEMVDLYFALYKNNNK